MSSPTCPWLIQFPMSMLVPMAVLLGPKLNPVPAISIVISTTPIGNVIPAVATASSCEVGRDELDNARLREPLLHRRRNPDGVTLV